MRTSFVGENGAVSGALVDQVAAGLPEETLRRIEDAFLTSSRFELLFWEMAWRQERWPA